MNKKVILALSISMFLLNSLKSQNLDDAIRNSWFPSFGSARFNALAGSTSSVGADLSASNINPAGLAFFNKVEFVIGTNNYENKYTNNYLGSNRNYYNKGNSNGDMNYFGIAIPLNLNRNNSVISFTYNKINDFFSDVQFNGSNYKSSLTQQYVEQLKGARVISDYPLGASLAFNTFLIDTSAKYGFKTLVQVSSGISQNYRSYTSGSYREYALAWAGNINKTVTVGFSLVFPVINYSQTKTYSEYAIKINADSNFDYFEHYLDYTSKGSGVGAKIGVIVKPNDQFRYGISLHTPQAIYFDDEVSASLFSNTLNYTKDTNISSQSDIYPYSYYYYTPIKLQLSGSYFWGNLKSANKLKGFISGEIEFVNYKGISYSLDDRNYDRNDDQSYAEDYIKNLNDDIKNNFQNNLNFKIGTEFSLYGWRLRIGASFYGSPYNSSNINKGVDKYVSSWGFGYRGNTSYFDLGFSTVSTKEFVFPYFVDSEKVRATINSEIFNVTFTYGIRF